MTDYQVAIQIKLVLIFIALSMVFVLPNDESYATLSKKIQGKENKDGQQNNQELQNDNISQTKKISYL